MRLKNNNDTKPDLPQLIISSSFGHFLVALLSNAAINKTNLNLAVLKPIVFALNLSNHDNISVENHRNYNR